MKVLYFQRCLELTLSSCFFVPLSLDTAGLWSFTKLQRFKGENTVSDNRKLNHLGCKIIVLRPQLANGFLFVGLFVFCIWLLLPSVISLSLVIWIIIVTVYHRHGHHHFNLKCLGSSCCHCSSCQLIFKPGQTNWSFPFLWTQGLTPLFYTVLYGGNPYCSEILLNDHAELHVADHQGKQEIHVVGVWMNTFLITVLVLYCYRHQQQVSK